MASANLVGGLLGGAMIGAASVLLLLFAGRVAGISGVLGGVVTWRRGQQPAAWRLAFLGGLVLGAALYRSFVGPLPLELAAHGPLLVAAGVLVGFGTRLGAGCTSGHGVCGIARRSPRSIVATLVFIAIAMLTVYAIRALQ